MGPCVVRRLATSEIVSAYPVLSQLRTLDEDAFVRAVHRQMFGGYELVGAFLAGRLVGVMGTRPVHTLARGAFLHIDDLVVDEQHRGQGIGRALIAFAEQDARTREMSALFLDSRDIAVSFYEKLGFGLHQSPSMRKPVSRG